MTLRFDRENAHEAFLEDPCQDVPSRKGSVFGPEGAEEVVPDSQGKKAFLGYDRWLYGTLGEDV